MNSITEVTYNDIVDIIKNGFFADVEYEELDYYERPCTKYKREKIEMTFCGKLEEFDFINRIFDTHNLPPSYKRFSNAAEEIWNHTVNNPNDFPPFWFFEYCPFDFKSDDSKILNFLCEIFHPAVRNENEPWGYFLHKFNDLLQHDGYELYPVYKMSGRDVYKWRVLNNDNVKLTQIEHIKDSFNSEYINKQIEIMNNAICGNPTEAIGKAKELCESCCKTILEENGIGFDIGWDLPKLTKELCKVLKLTPDDIDDTKKAADTIKGILGHLSAIPKGIGELRNAYGSGHGKEARFKGLSSRHAGLAVGSAITFVNFVWETHQDRMEIERIKGV